MASTVTGSNAFPSLGAKAGGVAQQGYGRVHKRLAGIQMRNTHYETSEHNVYVTHLSASNDRPPQFGGQGIETAHLSQATAGNKPADAYEAHFSPQGSTKHGERTVSPYSVLSEKGKIPQPKKKLHERHIKVEQPKLTASSMSSAEHRDEDLKKFDFQVHGQEISNRKAIYSTTRQGQNEASDYESNSRSPVRYGQTSKTRGFKPGNEHELTGCVDTLFSMHSGTRCNIPEDQVQILSKPLTPNSEQELNNARYGEQIGTPPRTVQRIIQGTQSVPEEKKIRESQGMHQSTARRSSHSRDIGSILRSEGDKPAENVSPRRKTDKEVQNSELLVLRDSAIKVHSKIALHDQKEGSPLENSDEAENFTTLMNEVKSNPQTFGIVGNKYEPVALHGDYHSRVSNIISSPKLKVDQNVPVQNTPRIHNGGFQATPSRRAAKSIDQFKQKFSFNESHKKKSPLQEYQVKPTPFMRSTEARTDKSLGEFIARRVQNFLAIQKRLQDDAKKEEKRNTTLDGKVIAAELLKEVQHLGRRRQKQYVAFDKFERRELGLNELDVCKPPRDYIVFKSKSEEERYMRIATLLQKMGQTDAHKNFVTALLASHRAEMKEYKHQQQQVRDRLVTVSEHGEGDAGDCSEDYTSRRNQSQQQKMSENEGMIHFTAELEHCYGRIFRFLQEVLTPEEYGKLDYVAVSKFIDKVQAIQKATRLYQKQPVLSQASQMSDPPGGAKISDVLSQRGQSREAHIIISGVGEPRYGTAGVTTREKSMFPITVHEIENERSTSVINQTQNPIQPSPLHSIASEQPGGQDQNSMFYMSEPQGIEIQQPKEEKDSPKQNIRQFVCDALGIKTENEPRCQTEMDAFAMKTFNAPQLWHTCKNIDVGEQYEVKKVQKGLDNRTTFVNMDRQRRNASLQVEMNKELKTSAFQSDLPLIIRKNYYENTNMKNGPLLEHMQKRWQLDSNAGRQYGAGLQKGGHTPKNPSIHLTRVNQKRMADDSLMKRNNLLLERVLLERNMAQWKTDVLQQIHAEKNKI